MGTPLTPSQRRLQNHLRERLFQASLKNPSYSLRALARDSGVSAPTLSGFLGGKRIPSRETAERLADYLDLPEAERAAILEGYDRDSYVALDGEKPLSLSSVYFFGLLSALEIAGQGATVEELADRLGMELSEAAAIAGSLVDLGLVRREAGGTLKASGEKYTVGDRGPNPDRHRFFVHSLQVTREKIEGLGDEERYERSDLSQMILAVDSRKLPEVKRRLRAFRRELARYFESGDRDAVYLLAFHVVPLTKAR